MAKRTLAVVTMAFNEDDFLPIWLRHHGRQVGRENCFVIDHGSTDASTAHLAGASLLRLPRTALDEEQRCRFVSEFCSSLLHWYDFVAYTDADELLVADPTRHLDLVAMCQTVTADITNAFGMNVIHRLGLEGALIPTGLVSRQRGWAMPVASMCKPSLISRPVSWAPGFHSADAPVAFGDLFLMHICFADIDIALRRQRRRQSQARARVEENPHHQVGIAEVAGWLESWTGLEELRDIDLSPGCTARAAFAQNIVASQEGRENERYRIDISIVEQRLWQLPQRFAGTF